VRPHTPLGPDQVDVLLLLYWRHRDAPGPGMAREPVTIYLRVTVQPATPRGPDHVSVIISTHEDAYLELRHTRKNLRRRTTQANHPTMNFECGEAV
jgi:hypothetical protein